MEKKDTGKGVIDSLQGAISSVKSTVQNVKLPEIKKPEFKAPGQIKERFKKRPRKEKAETKTEQTDIKSISIPSAIKTIYYLMAADGEIFHSEEEKFDAIVAELDPDFNDNKNQIVEECQAQLNRAIDSEDYYDALQDGVEDALFSSKQSSDTFITPKLLVWDLLTVAYSDENYNETERRLLKYVVRKLNMDKAVFLEMESSILTLMDMEKELAWIKTTDRPYLMIEAMVNEIEGRKRVIFASVQDLIAL